jgi:hypothetical protein
MTLFLPCYIIKGTSKSNKLPLFVGYIGSLSNTYYFYINLMFGSEPEINYAGKFFITRIIEAVKRKEPSCNMILFEPGYSVRVYMRNKPKFIIPNWIKFDLDISLSLKEMIKDKRSGYRNITRLIQKQEYTFTITGDQADFIDFYNNMYLPYSIHNFGNTASSLQYSDVFNPNSNRELLLLKKGNEAVGGLVIEYNIEIAKLCFFGVREGYFDLKTNGALGAAYYFSISILQKMGYKKLQLGDSRAFINDGVTRFKIRLLAKLDKLHKYVYNQCMFLSLLNDSPGLNDFLSHNPFLHILKNGNPGGVIWVSEEEDLIKNDFQKVYNRMLRAGTSTCAIYSGNPINLPEYSESENTNMSVLIQNANDCFLKA